MFDGVTKHKLKEKMQTDKKQVVGLYEEDQQTDLNTYNKTDQQTRHTDRQKLNDYHAMISPDEWLFH